MWIYMLPNIFQTWVNMKRCSYIHLQKHPSTVPFGIIHPMTFTLGQDSRIPLVKLWPRTGSVCISKSKGIGDYPEPFLYSFRMGFFWSPKTDPLLSREGSGSEKGALFEQFFELGILLIEYLLRSLLQSKKICTCIVYCKCNIYNVHYRYT